MPALMWVITAANFLLLFLMIRMYKADRKPIELLMIGVIFGLFYDGLILSLGTVMGEGSLLQSLSLPRYILHCGLIPLLFPICALALGSGNKGMTAVWTVTAIIILAGLAAGAVTKLIPEVTGGVTRYASDKAQTPAWSIGIQNALSYGPIVILMVCGIIVWAKQKRPELFLSGLSMFAFSALAPATHNMDLMFFISMFGEVLMVLFFYLYARKKGAKA